MRFRHSEQIWADFPQLAAGVLYADGITFDAPVSSFVAEHTATARSRLAGGTETELPEVQAWRRTFARMGIKPTQYRCASEALLRRLRKEGSLPPLHPLVDLCNALSVAWAIPVAALDVAKVTDHLDVRYADGSEEYLTFAGEVEHPAAGEVVFADGAGRAHARRWTNRQSGLSAVRKTTTAVLVVAEALHDSAVDDVEALIATLADEVATLWSTTAATALLSRSAPEFVIDPARPQHAAGQHM